MHVLTVVVLASCTGSPEPTAPVEQDATPAEPAEHTPRARERQGRKRGPRATGPADALMIKPALRDSRWANARCNDGTPFGLTVRQQPGATTWVVQLAGGYFCDDDVTACSGRDPRLTTTPPFDDGDAVRLIGRGLFSQDASENPVFAGANHVKAHYCSSDLWLGDGSARVPTTGSPEGWYFAGRANVQAAVEALGTVGLDDGDPRTAVLIVGHSAGGAGVVGNLDAIRELLPQTVERGQLKVLLDGSWVAPRSVDALPDADRWGPVHPGCADDHRARGEDPVLCIFGPNWWPYVARTGVPVLVQISGMDVTQTRVWSVKERADLLRWSQETRASLEGVPWVFSRGRPYHTLAFDDLGSGPPDRSFGELLQRFWAGDAADRVFWDYD